MTFLKFIGRLAHRFAAPVTPRRPGIMPTFPDSELAAKADEIKEKNPTARLLPPRVLREWAQRLLDGTHSSFTEPPADIDPLSDEESGPDGGSEDSDSGNEFGDVVELNGTKFVICTGLVVPLELLDSKILPQIQEYFDSRGITMESIFAELTKGVDEEEARGSPVE